MASPQTADNMRVWLAVGNRACTELPFRRPANSAKQQDEESSGFMHTKGRLRDNHRALTARFSGKHFTRPSTTIDDESRPYIKAVVFGEDGCEEAFSTSGCSTRSLPSNVPSRCQRCIIVMSARNGLATKSGCAKWRELPSRRWCCQHQEEPAS